MVEPLVALRPHLSTLPSLQNDPAFLSGLVSQGYSVFLLNITNQAYRQLCKDYFQSWTRNPDHSISSLHVPLPQAQHLEISNGHHIQHSVGLISNWFELDNDDIIINEFSFQAFQNEISYASYLGITTFLLSPPKDINNIQIFSSNISRILDLFPSIHISISLPISQDIINPQSSYIDIYSTWNTWNIIRIACSYNRNLSVSLGAPKLNISSEILDRWLLEPIKFYLISNSKFIPNAKNYPVLHKFNQLIIWKILQFKSLELPTFILYGVDKSNNGTLKEFDNNKSTYLSYIQYLISISTSNNFLSHLHSFSLDALKSSNLSLEQLNSSLILQNPIEPSSENLSNYMYKVFEQDTYKYEQYERAIIKALVDLQKSSIEEKPHVFFLGPGRGPLINRFFNALSFLSLSPSEFIITAIERNPNVIVTLNERNKLSWNNQVNILHMDARNYTTSDYKMSNPKINMVISELIGSFGCNELMPECIDSISTFDLCVEDCIFIPTNLKCYIAPSYCPKFWKLTSNDKSFDKMYVPMIQEVEILSQQPKEVWNYDCHTRMSSSATNKHNSRQSKISFNIVKKGIVHGLTGYFTSLLYADISIDNLPKNSDVIDCVSWLPSYFPIDTPMNVLEDNEISLYLQRICKGWEVWYEWSIQCYLNTMIENNGGHGNGTSRAKIPESLKFSRVNNPELEKPNELPITYPLSNRSSLSGSDGIFNISSSLSSNVSPSSLSINKSNRISSNNSNRSSLSNKATYLNDINILHDSYPQSQDHTHSKLTTNITPSCNEYHNSYSDYNVVDHDSHLANPHTHSHDQNHNNVSHVNFNKIKLCINVSRVHNLNGSGFKYRYD